MKKSFLYLSVVLGVVAVSALVMSYSAAPGGTVKQYAVVWMDINAGLPKFQDAVQDSLKNGWQLQGGVCMSATPSTPEVPAKSAKPGSPAEDAVAAIPGNTYYVQAIVK